MNELIFWVPGVPCPKGSLRAFTRKGGGVGVQEGNADKVRPWMSAITLAARDAGAVPTDEPVALGLTFYLPRPKGHFTSKGELKSSAPAFPSSKPDLDKLVRAVLDSLSGVAFVDDARVVALDPPSRKVYVNPGQSPYGPGLQFVMRLAP